MNSNNLGPAGRNILAILTGDTSNLSSAYTPDLKVTEIVDTPTRFKGTDVSDEYICGIDLESSATPFQDRLRIYGDVPMSTFSILA